MLNELQRLALLKEGCLSPTERLLFLWLSHVKVSFLSPAEIASEMALDTDECTRSIASLLRLGMVEEHYYESNLGRGYTTTPWHQWRLYAQAE